MLNLKIIPCTIYQLAPNQTSKGTSHDKSLTPQNMEFEQREYQLLQSWNYIWQMLRKKCTSR